jgi:hypothetical protein
VSAFTRWTLRIGGGAALVCGAILSFFALYGLAVMNGWPRYIAWALPGSVDVLTATAAIVAMSVPREHRGAKIAHWCAGVSLLITVGCNIEFHALLPATHWSIGHVFLVATGAVPAIVVELILVMQMYLGDGAALATAEHPSTVQPKQQPSKTGTPERPAKDSLTVQLPAAADRPQTVQPSTDRPSTPQPDAPTTDRPAAEVNDQAPTGHPNMERWVEIGHPVYLKVKTSHGKRPPEGAYRAALATEAARLIAAGQLPAAYDDPSVSTAKRVRAAVEDRFPELSPLHLIREAS